MQHKHFRLINPRLLRDAFASKRKFHRQLVFKKREQAPEPRGSPRTNASSYSLRDLTVLQWARCEEMIFHNVLWYFSLLVRITHTPMHAHATNRARVRAGPSE